MGALSPCGGGRLRRDDAPGRPRPARRTARRGARRAPAGRGLQHHPAVPVRQAHKRGRRAAGDALLKPPASSPANGNLAEGACLRRCLPATLSSPRHWVADALTIGNLLLRRSMGLGWPHLLLPTRSSVTPPPSLLAQPASHRSAGRRPPAQGPLRGDAGGCHPGVRRGAHGAARPRETRAAPAATLPLVFEGASVFVPRGVATRL